jgi:hypothetical protein
LGDKIKKLGAPGICHVLVREDVLTAFGRQNERDHLEDLGLEGRTILKCAFKKIEWLLGLD